MCAIDHEIGGRIISYRVDGDNSVFQTLPSWQAAITTTGNSHAAAARTRPIASGVLVIVMAVTRSASVSLKTLIAGGDRLTPRLRSSLGPDHNRLHAVRPSLC